MDIGNLPDGGVVLDADQFVVSRGGTARRIQGVRLVRTDISGNALLSGDPIITAGKKLRIGNTPALGGDGGDTTFLYTGDDALVVRNAADSATLFRLSSTGAGAITGTLNVTGALTQANNQVWHVGNFTPGNYVSKAGDTVSGGIVFNGDAQANARLIMSGSQFPAMTFQRSGIGAWYIGGIGEENNSFGVRLNANASFFQLSSSGGASFSSTLAVAGALTQAGNQVWHAGNLAPGNYAPLSGAVFTGPVSATANGSSAALTGNITSGGSSGIFLSTNFANGNSVTINPYVTGISNGGFEIQLSGSRRFSIGVSGASTFERGVAIASGGLAVEGAITQSGSQVWHAGNFAPGNYMPIAGGSFTGSISITSAGDEKIALIGTVNPYIGFYGATTATRYGYIQSSGGDLVVASDSKNVRLFAGGAEKLAATLSGVIVQGALNSTGAITQSGNQVWHAGNFAPSQYANLAGATFSGPVGAQSFTIPGVFGVTSSSFTSNVTSTFNAAVSGTSFNASGAMAAGTGMTVGGFAVWHAGNLNPAAYAPLAGAGFTGTVTAPNISATSGTLSAYPAGGVTSVAAATQLVIGEASKNSAYSMNVGYWLSGGQWRGTINAIANSAPAPLDLQFSGGPTQIGGAVNAAGAVAAPSFNATGAIAAASMTVGGFNVFHAGNFNPSLYAPLAGATFTGAIRRDANHYLDNSGNVALHVFDANDYIQYDRTNNKFGFIIGGTLVASIDSGGTLRVAGNVIGATAP